MDIVLLKKSCIEPGHDQLPAKLPNQKLSAIVIPINRFAFSTRMFSKVTFPISVAFSAHMLMAERSVSWSG